MALNWKEGDTIPRGEESRLDALVDAAGRSSGPLGLDTENSLRARNVYKWIKRAFDESRLDEEAAADAIAPWLARVESPIEAAFAAGAYLAAGVPNSRLDEILARSEGVYAGAGLDAAVGLESISSQRCHPCDGKTYRTDFTVEVVLCAADPGPHAGGIQVIRGVSVECDGREHHEGWDERRKDGERTRELMIAGAPSVIRFVGSEICQDPVKCALQSIESAIARLPSPSDARDLVDGARLRAIDAHLRAKGIDGLVGIVAGGRGPLTPAA